jgi:hypothetical protein
MTVTFLGDLVCATTTSLAKEVLETHEWLCNDVALGESEKMGCEGSTVLHSPHFVVAQVNEL